MIVLDVGAIADLERIPAFNDDREPGAGIIHIECIRQGMELLGRHPEIDRRIRTGSTLRELVISRGKTGYVALYEFAPRIQLIRIIAIRHQRESGYRPAE